MPDWIAFIIGFGIGIIAADVVFFFKYKRLGTLKIDDRDPEDIKMRFVFNEETDFSKHKHVTFSVQNHANLSQK